MINIDTQGDLPSDIAPKQIQDMANLILTSEAPRTDYEISLICADEAEMRRINKLYRGVNANTDVLSFEGECLKLGNRETRFCDIVIDTKQVFKQKGTNTYREEFWHVLIHALLHLAGYDHIRTKDKEKMEDAEDNYRKQIPEGLL